MKPVVFRTADHEPTGLFRHLVFSTLCAYRARHARESAKREGLATFDPAELAPKGNRRLFILGAGGSVLDLTAGHWAVVRAGTSIGMNVWPLHDFVPDAVTFERSNSHEKAEAISRALNREAYFSAQPRLLCAAPMFHQGPTPRVTVEAPLRGNMRVYAVGTLPIWDEPAAKHAVRQSLGGLRAGQLPRCVIPGIKASLDRLTMLGLALGFQEIVLLGVDLGRRPYFFEEDPSFLGRREVSPFSTGQGQSHTHKSDRRENHGLTVTECINALAEVGAEMFGARIMAGHEASPLAEVLPVFDWHESSESVHA